jgi:hypothetical protein
MPRPTPAALHHTCFVVRHLESTAQRLASALNVGPWHVFTIAPSRCLFRGKETSFTFRLALATVGGGTFELITPLSGRSVFDEFLEQHGDGFHHTCLMYPTIEAVRHAKEDLLRQGRECIQEGGHADAFDFAYFSFPEINSVVEVLYLDPARLPAPDAQIQVGPAPTSN